METVKNTLSALKLGEAKTFKSLTLFPLLSDTDSNVDYLTLTEALKHGVAHVREVSRGGSVPELRFKNTADLPVLIVDGEELVGAKQNRTVNLTILAPARKTIVIPVSCVEAGRWSHQSAEFAMSDRAHFVVGRAAKNAAVSRSLRHAGLRRSDQGRVWADISAKACRMDADSPTQAMAEIFERHRSSVDDYVKNLGHTDSQTGALFAIGNRIVGFDLFDRTSTLVGMLPKIVRSYAIDAIELDSRSGEHPDPQIAEAFMTRVAMAPLETYPAVGLGTDLRLAAPSLVGGGLALDDRLIHLAAFSMEEETATESTDSRGMACMSARRSWFRRR
jgi:hypothetical protein